VIYSTWDHARREYDYYQTPEKNGATQAPKPKHLSRSWGNKELGATPEEAAWPLPSNAVRIGAGKYPKGLIAQRKNGLSGLGGLGFIPDLTPTNMILMGALGWMTWTYVIKPKR
jgi:hypothetical protein